MTLGLRVAIMLGGAWAVALVSCSARSQEAPYRASDLVASVVWDFGTLSTAAPGSDLWPTTWADDDHLYAAWGDGGGFGGSNRAGRVSLGVARIEGTGADWQGFNVFGGKDALVPARFEGKADLVAVGKSLYLFVTEQGRWMRSKIGCSRDRGRTWSFSAGSFADSKWDFAETGGAFAAPVPLQFGRGYAGARDDFVYLYSEKTRGTASNRDVLLARVPRSRIPERNAYEFYAGFEAAGPAWTKDLARAVPVFTDPNGVNWGLRASYDRFLHRYLLTVRRPDHAGGREGAWGLFEAPEPWGPWSTIAYYADWDAGTPIAGIEEQVTYGFPTKWMVDAQTLWMVVSMNDSFNVIRGTLSLWRAPDASSSDAWDTGIEGTE